jgi:3-deoxy-7-phosphoheptulonate synthase
MLIVMGAHASEQDVERICEIINKLGYEARPIPGGQRTAIGIVGNQGAVDPGRFVGLPGVANVIPVSAPYKMVSREWKDEDTIIRLKNGTEIGGGKLAGARYFVEEPLSPERRPTRFKVWGRMACE